MGSWPAASTSGRCRPPVLGGPLGRAMPRRPAQGPTPAACGARGSPGASRRPSGHRAGSDCAGSPRS
eukprot:286663-Lingulodinium_polyedra.AAC.1